MLPHYLWKIKVQIWDKLHTRSTFSLSVMVSVGISKLGLIDLIFVDPGVNMNRGYYRDVLQSQQLWPVMCDLSGDFFVFQQDSALAHRACEKWDFLSSQVSQHPLSFLHICDCRTALTSVWSMARYGATSSNKCISRSCTALTNWRSICWTFGTKSWTRDDAVDMWCKRLWACVWAKGRHFEQLL